MRQNEQILLPHRYLTTLSHQTGISRNTIRLYLRGYYPKTSHSWDQQQSVRQQALRLMRGQ